MRAHEFVIYFCSDALLDLREAAIAVFLTFRPLSRPDHMRSFHLLENR